eukprot:1046425-Rhodomonas_salina.1
MLSMLSQTTVSALGFAGAHGVGCCWEQEIKDGKSDMDLLKIARSRDIGGPAANFFNRPLFDAGHEEPEQSGSFVPVVPASLPLHTRSPRCVACVRARHDSCISDMCVRAAASGGLAPFPLSSTPSRTQASMFNSRTPVKRGSNIIEEEENMGPSIGEREGPGWGWGRRRGRERGSEGVALFGSSTRWLCVRVCVGLAGGVSQQDVANNAQLPSSSLKTRSRQYDSGATLSLQGAEHQASLRLGIKQ